LNISKKTKVSSWGYGYSANSMIFSPNDQNELLDIIDFAKKENLQIALRGGANSFGDVFLANNNLIVDLSKFNTIKNFDRTEGTIVVEGGALIREILQKIMPQGWFLSGVSGSIDNTVAGSIAANVHGKDSWRWGNFGSTISSLKLLIADGTVIRVSKSENKELFESVIGGLGLIGVILEVTLKLISVSSLFVKQMSYSSANLYSIEENLYSSKVEHTDFAFSWIDGFSSGNKLGRGIIETGSFAPESEIHDTGLFYKSIIPRSKIYGLDPTFFWNVFKPIWSPSFLSVFNTLKYYNSIKGGRPKTLPYPVFNFPWSKLPNAKYSFYPNGFREYQVLFNRNYAVKAFEEILTLCQKNHHIPILCSIKRHKQDVGYLSFSGDGLSISINFLLKNFTPNQLKMFTSTLIDVTMKYDGVVYLAKFPDLPPEVFRIMYPQSTLFQQIKNNTDPNRIFWSDTAQKLFN
jgi:decaprenylphospho-beta-D-ribofuranose 2-oxidase